MAGQGDSEGVGGMTEQTENLTRVTEAIAQHVTAFVASPDEFHAADLRDYVYRNVRGYIAPASPDRILRSLRQRGVIDYEVVSRSKSLYRSIPVKGQMELFR